MSIIYILLPLALLLGFGFLAAFIWMSAQGQYDDLETPSHRLFLEEDSNPPVKLTQSSLTRKRKEEAR